MKPETLHRIKRRLPPWLKALGRRWGDLAEYRQFERSLSNPYASEPDEWYAEGSPCLLGIVRELTHYHKVNIAACRELGVSYKLLNLHRSDWLESFASSNCDAFLVWPSAFLTVWKDMYDDRLRILEQDMGKLVYPTCRETWIYENKRRTRDWLTARGLPQARTWVFYDRKEAERFVRTAQLPLVLKTNMGASHSGVWMLRRRDDAMRSIKEAFSRGLLARGRDFRDREWGVIYFQEYLENAREWRMMRIGYSYFGYRKEKVGDFHSGSGAWSWEDPPKTLLNLLHEVTERHGFSSMDIDFFEMPDGRYLINELQTVFGATTPAEMLRVNGRFGRYVREEPTGAWIFEEGDFSRNMCANARVDYLVNHLLKQKKRK